MTETYRHDPASYAVGDTIYVQQGYSSWQVANVLTCTIGRITPSGMIIGNDNGVGVRINPRGRVIGSDRWFVIGKARADELLAEAAIQKLWWTMRTAVAALERGVRDKDVEAVKTGISALNADLSRLTGPSA